MSRAQMWAYVWDFMAEGVDEVVGTLKDSLGMRAVSVATKYHNVDHFRPRARGPKWWSTHDAAVYFQPQTDLYGSTKIKPHVSPVIGTQNPLEDISAACVRAELDLVSWTIGCHDTYLGERNRDCVMVNCFGDEYVSNLCPSNPEVREFLTALVIDLWRNYRMSAIELEMFNFGAMRNNAHKKFSVDVGRAGKFLLGLCFCPSCSEQAEWRNVDVGRLRRAVAARIEASLRSGDPLDEEPAALADDIDDLDEFVAARVETVANLVREIKQKSGARLVCILIGDRWITGCDTQALAREADVIEILAYNASVPSPEAVGWMVQETADAVCDASNLMVGYQTYWPNSPDESTLLAMVGVALEGGVRDFSFYHYGIMPEPNFAWVRHAVELIKTAE